MPSINEIKSVFFKYWEMYKTYVLPFLPLITLMIALGVISYIKGGFNRLTLEGIVYLPVSYTHLTLPTILLV